jgi:hypothetical protein
MCSGYKLTALAVTAPNAQPRKEIPSMNDNDTLRKDTLALLALLEGERRKSERLKAALIKMCAYANFMPDDVAELIRASTLETGTEHE